MALQRMDNVLIVVEDLEEVKGFFLALGLEIEGETVVEGPMVGDLIGLKDVRATLVMLRPPNGQGGIELDKFHTPQPVRYGPVNAPTNALGLRRVMFAVDDIDGVVARLRARGSELIGEMRYGDSYRLAYIRGPEGILVGLAEEIGKAPRPRAKAAAKARAGKGRAAARPKRAPRTPPSARKAASRKAAREPGGAGQKRKA